MANRSPKLWGNLLEFSGSPPVLESAVMLHVPRSGADLEPTLDRGRIHLVNRKPNGAAQVSIRFARDFLELTLPDSGTEICLDLWNDPPRRDRVSAPSNLALYAKSPVEGVVNGRKFHMPARSHSQWTAGMTQLAIRVEKGGALPEWWAQPSKDEGGK